MPFLASHDRTTPGLTPPCPALPGSATHGLTMRLRLEIRNYELFQYWAFAPLPFLSLPGHAVHSPALPRPTMRLRLEIRNYELFQYWAFAPMPFLAFPCLSKPCLTTHSHALPSHAFPCHTTKEVKGISPFHLGKFCYHEFAILAFLFRSPISQTCSLSGISQQRVQCFQTYFVTCYIYLETARPFFEHWS